jgi:16S rRNA (guanine(1405)-N(7))-methyltransferase
MSADQAQVAQVVEAVLASAKHRETAPALVETLARRELAGGARPKEAVKAVKNKLHQVAGAYQAEPLAGDAFLAEVRAARAAGEDLRPLCRAAMARHTSTRERLPILDDFYRQLFAGLPPPRSLLDLACGLNPLALPWMGLPPDCTYAACDIYAGQAALLGGWLAAAGQPGEVFVCDLLAGPPPRTADVALLLKAIPCLQQMDRAIGRRLLDAVDAPVLIVSYPVHSLSGRKQRMDEHYAAEFSRLVEGRPWRVESFRFATELAYRVWR